MPKWIVLEFGTRSKADPLPKQFQISYTRRSERDFMLGPSVGKPYGNYKKKVFAMLSKKEFASMKDSHHADEVEKHYPDRPHPGTRPGRFFRKGLEDAKVPIYQEFGRGIENYLERINGR
jgi:hypothetical protein